MNQFAAELRRGIMEAQQASLQALEVGHPYEAYLHRARLADLVEVAGRHGVGTDALIAPEMRRALAEDEAALRD
ncbi:hypothetical protein [Amycolatopsis sp. GM8]|uniref:hypothetical protein n=1 Tax=Amycolatopsis sp. GM8 TaxID=2896530 RepID=UPI001F1E193E|nr:hypothetical protein [Amycolatopsis sp. GM8]